MAPRAGSPVDWSSLGWNGAQYAGWLANLPANLQMELQDQLPAQAGSDGPDTSPWDMAAGPVSELLSELGLLSLYGQTCAEYGLIKISQLTIGGPDGMHAMLHELGMTRNHRDKLVLLAFSARPCGTTGGVFSHDFLAAIRPAHAAAMGAENLGPMLYALLRFIKPRHVVEVGAGYTTLWLLQALSDNAAELERCAAAVASDGYLVGTPPNQAEWLLPPYARAEGGCASVASVTAAGKAGGTPAYARAGGECTGVAGESAASKAGETLSYARAEGECAGVADQSPSGVAGEPAAGVANVSVARLKADEKLLAHGGWASGSRPLLHTIDSMSHEHTTANVVCGIAEHLGLSSFLELIQADAYELPTGKGVAGDGGGEWIDVLWLDFGVGVGGRLAPFLEGWWPRIRPGGLLLVHSTLTNAVTRAWLDGVRSRHGGNTEGGQTPSACTAAARALEGELETMSFREPHKKWQNSISIFQKRSSGWAEPILTAYP